MFAYDHINDQYIEEFTPEFEEDFDQYKTGIALVTKRSSRASTRSIRRVFTAPARIIFKTGHVNIIITKVFNKHIAYFRDLGFTLINTRWRWILITLGFVNMVSFVIFGLLWMASAYASGDFTNETKPSDLCVVNAKGFAGYLLLSIETIMTIGYGFRYPTETCKHGWLLQILQAFTSIAIQGILISVVYVKMSSPFTKNSNRIFTKKAVICLRDGELCFIIRVIDLVKKILVGIKIFMYFIDKEEMEDKEKPYFLQEIKIEPYGLYLFPLEIIHKINKESPLWSLRPFELLTKRYEIIVVAEGSSIITGQLSQHRTSYKNNDILWGARWEPCVEFDVKTDAYIVDIKNFNKTKPFNTPLLSALELKEMECILKENGNLSSETAEEEKCSESED